MVISLRLIFIFLFLLSISFTTHSFGADEGLRGCKNALTRKSKPAETFLKLASKLIRAGQKKEAAVVLFEGVLYFRNRPERETFQQELDVLRRELIGPMIRSGAADDALPETEIDVGITSEKLTELLSEIPVKHRFNEREQSFRILELLPHGKTRVRLHAQVVKVRDPQDEHRMNSHIDIKFFNEEEKLVKELQYAIGMDYIFIPLPWDKGFILSTYNDRRPEKGEGVFVFDINGNQLNPKEPLESHFIHETQMGASRLLRNSGFKISNIGEYIAFMQSMKTPNGMSDHHIAIYDRYGRFIKHISKVYNNERGISKSQFSYDDTVLIERIAKQDSDPANPPAMLAKIHHLESGKEVELHAPDANYYMYSYLFTDGSRAILQMNNLAFNSRTPTEENYRTRILLFDTNTGKLIKDMKLNEELFVRTFSDGSGFHLQSQTNASHYDSYDRNGERLPFQFSDKHAQVIRD